MGRESFGVVVDEDICVPYCEVRGRSRDESREARGRRNIVVYALGGMLGMYKLYSFCLVSYMKLGIDKILVGNLLLHV